MENEAEAETQIPLAKYHHCCDYAAKNGKDVAKIANGGNMRAVSSK